MRHVSEPIPIERRLAAVIGAGAVVGAFWNATWAGNEIDCPGGLEVAGDTNVPFTFVVP